MYFRMIIVLIIGLYSSRVLLQNLGVDDFGIFNVVGSIIAMVGMLNSLFASSTQRFLNYEMGRKNYERLNLIFNMSVIINVIIAIVFFVVIEAIGIWFLAYKINIDPSRMTAARWVFQLSVISSVINIMNAPLNAEVIANEKMNFYALVSVLDAVLKLAIILLLPVFGGDRLIIYALLLLGITLFNRIILSVYCRHYFRECRYKRCWERETFKKMASFAGWQLFGNSAFTLTQNGLNLIFNVFGGVVVNTARGIAYQVNAAVGQFLNNVIVAISPYSVKSFASNNTERMFDMFFFSSKMLFVIDYCLIVPILYNTYTILNLWLGVVPDYTVGFVQIVLLWSLVRSVHEPINMLFNATGQLKQYQLSEGVILSLPLIGTYFILDAGESFYVALSSMIIFEIINLFVILFWAYKIVGLNLKRFFKEVFMLMIFNFAICLIPLYYLINNHVTVLNTFLISLLVDFVCIIILFVIKLNSKERDYIRVLVNQRKRKK